MATEGTKGLMKFSVTAKGTEFEVLFRDIKSSQVFFKSLIFENNLWNMTVCLFLVKLIKGFCIACT